MACASATSSKMDYVVTNNDQDKTLVANSASSHLPNMDSVKTIAPYYFEGRRMSHVPEPEGWAMMVLGVGFVIFQVRRRRRARESWDLR